MKLYDCQASRIEALTILCPVLCCGHHLVFFDIPLVLVDAVVSKHTSHPKLYSNFLSFFNN